MNGLPLGYVSLALLLAAFLLIGAEIYIPGGILGTLGAVCLVAAVVLGFRMGPTAGWASVGLVAVMAGFGLYFWLRVFPRSRAGRKLTLELDGRDFKSARPEMEAMVGREGVAQSGLRPSGVATMDGRRVDVVADHGLWLDAGTPVRVTRVSGGRLYVEPAGTGSS